jgi:hypothetical protein
VTKKVVGVFVRFTPLHKLNGRCFTKCRFLKNSGIELGKGIKVNRYLETNIKDIYATCAEQREAIDERRPY